DFQSLKICPAAASSPGTPAASPSVETDLGSATSIDCYQATPGGSCTYILRFVPHGFAAGTSFQALSRVDAANNPWVLAPDPVAAASSSSVTLVLTAAAGGPPAQVQFAILAFPGTPPSSSTEVQQLRQTAASYAFVTQELTVHAVGPTPTPT